MRKIIYGGLLLMASAVHAQLAVVQAGMKITSSVKVRPGTYQFNTSTGLDTAVIEIEGNNIVVDFNHAVLDGNGSGASPATFFGLCIKVRSGKNITIKNLTARGYKVALMAKGIAGLTIEHCDFSYNYRQHLNSTQQKEDLSDWMSYHHNEKDEWLRYGAAMYLRGCNKAVVHDNRVAGGQCALMLTQCDSGMIYNNNFSFNSGIGVGMYRSSANKIIYNKLDFNVRGHSEGVYNRGQDAAAILVFEQCNNNVYASNSATHSGDGFFLWAGQTTMDSGEGGCNDNLVYANDFSYAPTNGIEVTFSRNKIFGNVLKGCDNGLWGGYSYQTKIWGNHFEKNKVAIAIEHGQENEILFNEFMKDETGIKLWAQKEAPSDWGYPKTRDTRSYRYTIAGNKFEKNKKSVVVSFTDSLMMALNEYQGSDTIFSKGEAVYTIDTAVGFKNILKAKEDSAVSINTAEMNKYQMPALNQYHTLNRSAIRMTEWGPYDFKSPLIWNTNPVASSDTMQFEITGPKGNWKVVDQRGVKNISSFAGSIPAAITAIKTNEKGQDVFIELEYTGENITTVLGEEIAKGKSFRFNYRNALLPASWQVNWYAFDSLQDPIKNPAVIAALVKQPPVLSAYTSSLNYAWWSGVGKEKKYEQFLTIAEADIDFPEGAYEMGISWEDVVRVYIDGQLIMDEWKPAEHVYDESPHREIPVTLAGKHQLRVEHANQAGFATLIIKLKKK